MSAPDTDLVDRILYLALRRQSGDLTTTEFSEFEGLLISNTSARELYAHFMYDSLKLAAVFATDEQQESADSIRRSSHPSEVSTESNQATNKQFSEAIAPRAESASSSLTPQPAGDPLIIIEAKPAVTPHSGPRRRSLRDRFADQIEPDKHLLHFAAVVAFITLGSWAYFIEFVGAPAFHRDDVATVVPKESEEPEPESEARYIARLVKMAGAVWGESERWRAGDGLSQDDVLEFTKGLVEIRYDSGVRVILEGPVEFKIGGPKGGQLDRGTLAAQVLEHGNGFNVQTPGALVVDIGTEFGVQVSDSGATEVVVLSGEVDLVRESSGERVRLTAGQGALVGAGGSRIAIDKDVDARVFAPFRSRVVAALLGSRAGDGVTIANCSFEFPVTTNYTASIGDWTLENPDGLTNVAAGVNRESGSIFPDHISAGGAAGDGAQWGFLQFSDPAGGQGVHMTTTHSLGTVAAGTYALTFDIGRRTSCDGDLGSSVVAVLLSDGVSFGRATVALRSASDNRMDADMVLVATVNAEDVAVGGNLRIRISHEHHGASPGTGLYQAAFDKVRLVVTPPTLEAVEEGRP